MKTQVILVAAGSGTRFKSAVPKPFVRLKGQTLIARSLKIFEQNPSINGIIVVGSQDHLVRFEALRRTFKKVRAVVPGGKTRADSVKCGLAALDEDTRIVLVHDAARPLIDTAMLGRILTALKGHKAVIAAVPVKSTIKQAGRQGIVTRTLPRELLWDVQTPQGFHKNILVRAHAGTFKGEATDDAMLVEGCGGKVKVVMGSYANIKITTPEDLKIAKALIS